MTDAINLTFRKSILLLSGSLTFIILSCSPGSKVKKRRPALPLTSFVDPFIGTGFHGHVFLDANVTFGAVQLGPVNISTGWDWCSGYHYSDTTIIFSHTHLSGTGIGDLGDISFMPATGNVVMAKGLAGYTSTGYYSTFTHNKETAKPGYYAVHLGRYNIKAGRSITAKLLWTNNLLKQ